LTAKTAKEDHAVAATARLLDEWGIEDRVVEELLVCLRLCRARVLPADRFHIYATSLPSRAPGVAAWPSHLRALLGETSLGPMMAADDTWVVRWESLLREVCKLLPGTLVPAEAHTITHLRWAYGMLHSRQFAIRLSGAFGLPRASDVGCLVPFLDMANHQASADITMRPAEGMLEFTCGEAVHAGQQLWGNYGSKGNEELLHCYGFATPDNADDDWSISDMPGIKKPFHLTRNGLPTVLRLAAKSPVENVFREVAQDLWRRRSALQLSLSQLAILRKYDSASTKSQCNSARCFLEGQLEVLEACLLEFVDTPK